MDWLIWIAVTLGMTAFMEFVAWFTHKYIMHGFLWVLHEDHHRAHKGFFEKNDLFAVFFAVPSFLLVFFGLKDNLPLLTSLGAGMTLYGIGYTLFHDIIFHRRLKLKVPRFGYLNRIINAHRFHHAAGSDKTQAQAYGFLWAGPWYNDFPPRGKEMPKRRPARSGAEAPVETAEEPDYPGKDQFS